MKDFKLRNDTKLFLLNDPVIELQGMMAGKRTLFVFGNGSVFENGCYDDVFKSAKAVNAQLYELAGASRELADIERGIALCKEKDINLVIGAGGASIMDCAKLIAFGARHEEDLWDYVKGRKDPYGREKLSLVLMPTYPSSGSEYGLGAVSADNRTGDFGTAYGIGADVAILVPKYALTLDAEMTAYTGLVTLVQLCAATLGDTNPVSYNIGIAVIKQVLEAVKRLKDNPQDLDARGIIAYGASISTSSRLGLGKEGNYAYEIYEVEFVPEVLFGVPYRRSLTTIFPRFLAAMAPCHSEDIARLLRDAFGLEGDMAICEQRLVDLFESLGVPMYFDGEASQERIAGIDFHTSLTTDEVTQIIDKCLNHATK